MSAPKGNTNAETWSKESAIELFELVLTEAKEQEKVMVQGSEIDAFKCHFIGEAADNANTTVDVLKYIRDKYNLKDLYSNIKRKCERNCFTDSKKGIIVPSLAIMNLKSNHGWTDRVDNTSKGESTSSKPIQIEFVKKTE